MSECDDSVTETPAIVGVDLEHDPLPFDLRSDGDVWFGTATGVFRMECRLGGHGRGVAPRRRAVDAPCRHGPAPRPVGYAHAGARCVRFGRLAHYTPSTDALVPMPARVDQGYGDSPLRFDRVPGLETQIRTRTGGWSETRTWIGWDLGVRAP